MYIYIKKNLIVMESWLSFEDKTTQHWFSFFQIARKYYKSYVTDPLNTVAQR